MTYKPPHPERVPDGGKRAHKVLIDVGGLTLQARGDAPPLGGVFRDRTEEYGAPMHPDNVDLGWRARIRREPCLLWRAPVTPGTKQIPCFGMVQCAHVHTQGADTGGPDRGNTVPLCVAHHDQQHTMGIESFQRLYGLDLQALAIMLADEWG